MNSLLHGGSKPVINFENAEINVSAESSLYFAGLLQCLQQYLLLDPANNSLCMFCVCVYSLVKSGKCVCVCVCVVVFLSVSFSFQRAPYIVHVMPIGMPIVMPMGMFTFQKWKFQFWKFQFWKFQIWKRKANKHKANNSI